MALVVKRDAREPGGRHDIVRYSDKSAVNAALTVTTTGGGKKKLLAVLVKYSSSAARAVSVKVKSGLGVEYDVLLDGDADVTATDGAYQPAGEIIIGSDDQFQAVAVAAGADETETIQILTEEQ